MKRAMGFVVFLVLIAGAVWVGIVRGADPVHGWVLRENGSRAIGELTLDDDHICWDLDLEYVNQRAPKGMMLHHDATGPLDPVAIVFYEPPEIAPEGCAEIDEEYIGLLADDATDFYVDGHDSDDAPVPVMWADLSIDKIRHRAPI